MSYPIYYPAGDCGTNLPDHLPAVCPNENVEQGRVRSVAMIQKDYLPDIAADPSDPAPWIAGIQTKKIRIIFETQGSYDGGTPVMSAGYGDLKERITAYDHVLTFKDPAYKTNGAFYNALFQSNQWVPAWRSETQIHVASKPATWKPKNEIGEDISSDVVWTVEAAVTQSDLILPFDIPAGIFDKVFDYD